MKMYPSIEIIIAHYNKVNLIKDCLKSLSRLDYPNFKITIVDNGSNDGSIEFIEKNYPRVNLIKNKTNLFFVGANNQAMKRSKSDYLFLLNNDTEVDKDCLKELIKVAEANKNIFSCQPKILDLNNKKKFEYAGAGGGFIDKYGYPLCRGRIFDTIEKDNGQYDDQIEIFWSCGVAMLIRKSILDKTGYFDKDFVMYAEEVDLSWRAILVGYKNIFVPKAKIYHLGKGSSREVMFKTYYYLHRNHILILIKNYSFKSLIPTLLIKIFFEITSIARFLFLGDFKRSIAIIYSLLWIISYPILIWKKHSEIQRLRKVNDKEVQNKMISKSISVLYFLKNKKYFKDYKKFIPLLN